MASIKPTTTIHPHPEDVNTILSQREALKYFKSGLSSSLGYELLAHIPIMGLPQQNPQFIIKYVVLRLTQILVL